MPDLASAPDCFLVPSPRTGRDRRPVDGDDETGIRVLIEQNKEAARRFFDEIWNQKDETAIARHSAADVQGNDPDFGTSREEFKGFWRERIAAFPDLHFEILDLIAEGDQVLTRWVMTGTHLGPYLGAVPTGRKIRVDGMSLDRFKDGIVIAGFDGWDALGFRQQLGLIPKDE